MLSPGVSQKRLKCYVHQCGLLVCIDNVLTAGGANWQAITCLMTQTSGTRMSWLVRRQLWRQRSPALRHRVRAARREAANPASYSCSCG